MNDIVYLRERALQELRAAIHATDERARKAHLDMADAYSCRLRQMQAAKQRSQIRLIEAA